MQNTAQIFINILDEKKGKKEGKYSRACLPLLRIVFAMTNTASLMPSKEI